MDRKRELLLRVYVVMFVFIAFTLIILIRIATISIVEGDELKSKIDKYMKLVDVETDRGSIYAEDLSVLAASIQFFEIRMDPTVSTNALFGAEIDSLGYYLEQYSDVKRSRWQWANYLEQQRDNGNRYVLLANKVNYDLFRKFKTFPVLRHGKYKGGLIGIKDVKRTKPYKELAARSIGLSRDYAEDVGLEGYYDHFLQGDSIKQLQKRLAGNIWIPVLEPGNMEYKKGADLVTTIDVEIQDIVHDELMKAAQMQNATMATAVIMEVKTGAIKAISNLTRNDNGLYEERYNHAIGRSTEPGSTFKLASAMCLLNDGIANKNTRVPLSGGKKKFYTEWMYDDHPADSYDASLSDVIVKSSNVGIGTMIHKAYGAKDKRQAYYNGLDAIGLTQKTGIDLHGEPVPYIKNPSMDDQKWSGTTAPWMAHGYELMLTPLQILNFYNAIANNGKLMKPYLVNKIVKGGEVVRDVKPKALNEKIASENSIKQIKEMLEQVVLKGTAKNIRSDKYNFAGKTGTTKLNYNSIKKEQYNASFAGYFPAEQPKYSMIVVMYEPQKSFYGNKAAGTVFKAIADRCFALKNELKSTYYAENAEAQKYSMPKDGLGMADDFKEVLAYADLPYQGGADDQIVSLSKAGSKLKFKSKKINKSTIPDVRGMGLKDAIYVLEDLGMTVDAQGIGRVVRQNILPGTRISGQEIELYLN